MSSYDSIMLDLETMSTENNGAIVSIGMFKFDLHGSDTYELISEERKFHISIDLVSCQRAGLQINGETVLWWMGQSDEARKALVGGVDLRVALSRCEVFMKGNFKIWGHGSTFDNVLLRNAFKAIGIEKPWSHRNDLCYRTMRTLFGNEEDFIRYGTYHNALDDAISQGIALQRMVKRLANHTVHELVKGSESK